MRDDLIDDGDSNSGGKPPRKARASDKDPLLETAEMGLPHDAATGLVRRHDIHVQLPSEQVFVRPDQFGTGVAYFQPVELGRSNAFSTVALPTGAFQPVNWDCFWFKGSKSPVTNEADQLIGSFLVSLLEFIAKLLGGRKVSFRQKIRSMKER